MNTPFKWMKTVASHLGGTRNGMVVAWPKRITDHGGLRSQFAHVDDVVPTVLEAAGIPAPAEVDGVKQKPIDGTSLIYSFADAKAPERHTVQYFEVFGHRAIYKDGWMASAFHSRLPWTGLDFANKPFESDTWELYDLRHDFSQAKDLAAKDPAKLAEMKALFTQVAGENQVLPLENIRPGSQNRLPSLSAGRTSVTYGPGTRGIPETALPKTYNHSWGVTATVDVAADSSGVVAALGGSSAGWTIWLDAERRPILTYKLFDLKTVTLRGAAPLAPGRHQLRFDFAYDGGGFAKGATISFGADGSPIGQDRIPASPPALYSIDETFDVGLDHGSPVAAYPDGSAPGYAFTGGGAIEAVTIAVR